MPLFERFTAGARDSVTQAHKLAVDYEAIEIAPIHLLGGVAHCTGENQRLAVASLVLREMGLTDETLAAVISQARFARRQVIIGKAGSSREPEDYPPPQLPFTSGAKKSLELALREAISLGHNYIGPEHILLGLLRVDDPDVMSTFIELPRHNLFRRLSHAS